MKRIATTVIGILLVQLSFAQSFTGTVFDRDTRLPVPDVHVFWDGTTYATTTNRQGKFILPVLSDVNTSLILSHVSYEVAVVKEPLSGSCSDSLFLVPKVHAIAEVVVARDLIPREEKLKAFREEFLGHTKAGKSCRILNEEDVMLHFNSSDLVLTAWSDKPLTIENPHLGYTIHYRLAGFSIQYEAAPVGSDIQRLLLTELKQVATGISSARGNITTLKNMRVMQTYNAGYAYFEEKAKVSNRTRIRRKESYLLSTVFFFRSLLNKRLEEDGFRVYADTLALEGERIYDYFRMLSKEEGQERKKEVWINSPVRVTRKVGGVYPYGILFVDRGKKNRGAIIFLTDHFTLDVCGSHDQLDKVLFGGYLHQQRAGDLLPLEYEP